MNKRENEIRSILGQFWRGEVEQSKIDNDAKIIFQLERKEGRQLRMKEMIDVTHFPEYYQSLVNESRTVRMTESDLHRVIKESVKHILSEIFDEKNENDYRHFYMLLDRLRMDCEYYLGYGGRCKHQLWAQDEQKQIDKMRELYNILPEKPEWITMEDIDNYAEQMGVN